MKSIFPAKMRKLIKYYCEYICREPQLTESDMVEFVIPSIEIREELPFQVAYRKGTADEDVIAHSFDRDIFFKGVPEYKPEEGHVIIDLGAHIGTFSLLSSSMVPHGHVFSVEASKDTCNILKINMALNNCNNVSIHNLALAGKDGETTLYHDLQEGNWGHSTVRKLSKTFEKVPCNTLETFMRNNEIVKCHFMKLNVEGAEFPILLNASQEILQRFEVILVLYHCDIWTKNTHIELMAHLEASGFNCVVRQKTEERGWIIATL